MAYDYEYFKKAIFEMTKIDLNAYKEKQMKRPIVQEVGFFLSDHIDLELWGQVMI